MRTDSARLPAHKPLVDPVRRARARSATCPDRPRRRRRPAVCSVANALARATLAPSPLIYWAGVLLIALPIFYRLTSREASPGERLGPGLPARPLPLPGQGGARRALFTFSDELVHAFNANQIVDHHHLFRANPILR